MKSFMRGIGQGMGFVGRAILAFAGNVFGAMVGRILGPIIGAALVLGVILYLINPSSLLRLLPGGGGPATRSVGTVIQGIRGMSTLATAEFKGTATNEVVNKAWLPFLPDERLMLATEGTILAGIDLSQITEQDVTITDEDVTIRLPSARIISVDIQHQLVQTSSGMLPGIDPAMQPQAEQQGRADLLAAACRSGLLGRAEQEAQQALRSLLSTLDFRAITFVQEGAAGRSGCAGQG